jgi:hypothetical protein
MQEQKFRSFKGNVRPGCFRAVLLFCLGAVIPSYLTFIINFVDTGGKFDAGIKAGVLYASGMAVSKNASVLYSAGAFSGKNRNGVNAIILLLQLFISPKRRAYIL